MAFYDDIPNVADCSDVAQLYECALLTINNSKLLRDWVNGSETTNVTLGGQSMPSLRKLIQNINRVAGIATSVSAGAVRPDNVTTQVDALGVLSVIISGLIENGGGLVTGSNGKLAVDFSDMPTDKFEKLLKALRLPIWLTGNTNFYVNKSHANASDTLDDGRGISASKPFKTIQACVNYICNNYNIGPYTAYITVSEDVYEENLILPDFSRTSGKIVIRSVNTDSGYVKLTGDFSTSRLTQIACIGGIWDVIRPKIFDEFNYNTASYKDTAEYIQYVGFYSYGGDLTVTGPYFDITLSGTIANALRFYGFFAEDSKLSLKPDITINTRLYMQDTVQCSSRSKIAFLSSGQNASISFASNNAASEVGKHLRMNGDFDRVASAINKGSIACASVNNNLLVPSLASGKTVTGRRYVCLDGGTMDVKGRGPAYFPGTLDGTVESSTYSWYK